MSTDGERIATLEALFGELGKDVRALTDQSERSRRRLHDVEGTLGLLVDQEKVRRQMTADNQRRMRTRLEILTVVVGCAALVEPFLYHLAIGG